MRLQKKYRHKQLEMSDEVVNHQNGDSVHCIDEHNCRPTRRPSTCRTVACVVELGVSIWTRITQTLSPDVAYHIVFSPVERRTCSYSLSVGWSEVQIALCFVHTGMFFLWVLNVVFNALLGRPLIQYYLSVIILAMVAL